jgi:hypothetical protein
MHKLLLVLGYLAFTNAMAASAECMALRDIPPPVAESRLLVFGEFHGSTEVPEFVGAYACAISATGRPLVLGLEIPSGEQRLIDQYMRSPGGQDDRDQLLTGAFWHQSNQDGRSSQAMLALLERLHALGKNGGRIAVLAIDTDNADLGANGRDAVMAVNIRSALRRPESPSVIALVGNLHAQKTRGNSFDQHFESMTYQLSSERPIALNMHTTGGTAWACRRETGGEVSCQPGLVTGSPSPASAPAKFLLNTADQPRYDGRFYIGAMTASPPAATAMPVLKID